MTRSRLILLIAVLSLAALSAVSPAAADPRPGTCPAPFEPFVYTQPPNPFFVAVDVNDDGVLCFRPLPATPGHPDSTSWIDNLSQKPVG